MGATADSRKALVTGGASGFGRAIAAGLVRTGASVAVLDVDAERVGQIVDQLGDAALGITADVRSAEAVGRAVTAAHDRFGGLDTVIVSAGVFQVGDLEAVTEESWDRTLDVNLKGAFLTAQAAAAPLRASGRGRIVTIGSDCGRRGFAGQVAYVASKFGLVGLTEALAAELAPDGVTVNCVCPVGCPTTAMGREVLRWKTARMGLPADTIVARAAATNPLGRNATEADVTEAVLFFVSEAASFLTGVTLDVDGGARLGTVPGLG
ncbi:SDR family NAD(P)-dependent oxidoreductase [Virgisporangium aurantiacum]|uniref:3-oxoacyl-ACP reductase n=1 Tax=Virgisporangium aurantiacum TaxID=175570 RepID=A0A8J3ZKJ6_9ACTN|nr:SDR family NAD(P)-dependent oxidoreductase [Virgisporangium aurantiacum]GIJ63188.1 3-oxoacyl-ACP reductase [Virgisporangium aurantiacum]